MPVNIANPNVQQALDFFQRQGWSPQQACGIVANLWNESRLKDNAPGDFNQKTNSYDAYGAGQWHPDRQQAFQNWTGKPIQGSSLEDQLGFVQHELTQGDDVQARRAGQQLKQATTPAAAAGIFMRGFERPSDPNGAKEWERGLDAEDLHKAMFPAEQNGTPPQPQQVQPRPAPPSLSPSIFTVST